MRIMFLLLPSRYAIQLSIVANFQQIIYSSPRPPRSYEVQPFLWRQKADTGFDDREIVAFAGAAMQAVQVGFVEKSPHVLDSELGAGVQGAMGVSFAGTEAAVRNGQKGYTNFIGSLVRNGWVKA